MDFATAKKILGPKLHPLTSSELVDEELYIWLATIYRQFISPWYARVHHDGPLAKDIVDIFQKLIETIISRLSNRDLVTTLQHVISLLDQHLLDVQTALERCPHDPNRIYLGFHPHIGIGGKKELSEYLSAAAAILLKELLNDTPDLVQSLLVAVIQQVLGAVVGALGQPWMLHELIIKALDPSNTLVISKGPVQTVNLGTPTKRVKKKRQSLRHRDSQTRVDPVVTASRTEESILHSSTETPSPSRPARQSQWIGAKYLLPISSNTNDSIFLFIQHHFVSQSLLGSFIMNLSWPLHPLVSRLLNTALTNGLTLHLTTTKYLWIASTLRNALFPGGYMGPPRVVPSAATQQKLRSEACRILNTKAHMKWIDERVFDSTTVNQRFVLSLLDYGFSILVPNSPHNT